RQMTASVASATIVPGGKEPAAKGAPTGSASTKSDKLEAANAPTETIQRYQVLISGIQKLRQTQLDLFAKYTAESQVIKANQAEIDELENQRREMEKKYPDLPTKVGPIGSKDKLDPASEAAHLAGLQAKRDALAARVKEIHERRQQLVQLSPQIEDLERQRQ